MEKICRTTNQTKILSENDDFEQVSDALFLVDQYIFPDLFGSKEKAKKFTRELFSSDLDALFSYNKTLVAKEFRGCSAYDS